MLFYAIQNTILMPGAALAKGVGNLLQSMFVASGDELHQQEGLHQPSNAASAFWPDGAGTVTLADRGLWGRWPGGSISGWEVGKRTRSRRGGIGRSLLNRILIPPPLALSQASQICTS